MDVGRFLRELGSFRFPFGSSAVSSRKHETENETAEVSVREKADELLRILQVTPYRSEYSLMSFSFEGEDLWWMYDKLVGVADSYGYKVVTQPTIQDDEDDFHLIPFGRFYHPYKEKVIHIATAPLGVARPVNDLTYTLAHEVGHLVYFFDEKWNSRARNQRPIPPFMEPTMAWQPDWKWVDSTELVAEGTAWTLLRGYLGETADRRFRYFTDPRPYDVIKYWDRVIDIAAKVEQAIRG